VKPTTLYPKRKSVQGENQAQLLMLDAETARRYQANDVVELHPDAPHWVRPEEMMGDRFFVEDCQAGKEVELRLNAQVMLLRNETADADGHEMRSPGARRLVNGSRGVVIGFDYACPLRTDDRGEASGGDGGKAGGGGGQAGGGGGAPPGAPDQHGGSVQPTCGCGGLAAWACPRRRCGNCCDGSGGCDRHAKGGGGGGGGPVGRPGGGGGAGAAPREAEPRAGDDYVTPPPPMPTGPPPPSALLSPLWQHERAADGRECWRHRATAELTYERPAPVLYPVVRFIGHRQGQPGRVRLVRPEPFERHIYLKGTLTRTQVQHHPRPIHTLYPSQDPLRGSGRSAHPESHAPHSMPRTRYPNPNPWTGASPCPVPDTLDHRYHSRSHGRSPCTRRKAPPSTTCTSTWTVASPKARPTSPSPARAPGSV